ncbi:DNA primase [Chlorobaculum limnaeum]|uniref:DNA primase n=1 Tax=Chlorobaculum limnaeum TaxID=274537 RepID=A0A1D8DA54_CHLLM|nr:DNA primase [Chlorobaculum limnaeum]
MIPERMIDEIRQSTDIVDVVSDYVRLQPSGQRFKALSPFTQEKTPSFIVSPDRQMYKCFSSGKGGNVFTFVMEMEKVTFPEAVEMLAKRAGIDTGKYRTERPRQDEKRESAQFDTLRWAARLFHSTLESEAGGAALAYLTGKRGLEPGTIRRFGLGFAPESWDYLLHAAERDRAPIEQLVSLGLLTRHPKRNTLYDTFRNRVIFPIFTVGGQVAGFGGRTLASDAETPKYINSPESASFEKSKLLYGMHAAKNEIRRRETAILVEGYMDVIAMHQAGFPNTVASCGTALTRYQAKILKRYTSRVLFLYDGDNAGKKSMLAGIDILLAEGLTPWVVMLPGAEDPDSFIRNYGKEAFLGELESEKSSFQDFQLRCYQEAGWMESPDTASKAISAMTRSIALIADPVQKELYLDELAKKLDLGRQTLREVMATSDTGRGTREPRQRRDEPAPQPPARQAPLSVTERTFLEALLESTFYGNEVLAFAASHESMFHLENPAAQAIFGHLVTRFREMSDRDGHIDITSEISSIGMEEAGNLAFDILFRLPVNETTRPTPAEIEQHARRCLSHFLVAVKTLVLEPLQKEKESINAQLQCATAAHEQERLSRALLEHIKHTRAMEQEVDESIRGILGE